MLHLNNDEILQNFPNIELCFETIIHKTVPVKYNYVLAIPEGRKYFAWFTTYKTQNVCFLLEISNNKQICNIECIYTCFHKDLAYETVLYGTGFKQMGRRFFSCEDIYMYKGTTLTKNTHYSKKLIMFQNIFKNEIKQVAYNNQMITFGLPIMSVNIDNLNDKIRDLSYKIKYIQFRTEQNQILNKPLVDVVTTRPVIVVRPLTVVRPVSSITKPIITKLDNKKNDRPKDRPKEKIFKIKADIQNDIYNLYDVVSNELVDIAYIPDYKTSVMMNKLFRNIKENQNLDALEESDDEEEFENDKIDKFVYLDRSFDMICEYNMKYKRWQPQQLR
jgi:hypothetical protein